MNQLERSAARTVPVIYYKKENIDGVDVFYLRDLPTAELHLLDSGHFALEDQLDVMAPLIRDFLDREVQDR